ncbi:AAA family ATPase [Metabacillus sp. cB07]|uniref:uridine kinase family protein n=1 Tax=Metabacillus sp. cB07 TaxID=2806989 RepID=UPI00193A45F2|nr:AAA family ATPase [Metabacillus sp. cB07]
MKNFSVVRGHYHSFTEFIEAVRENSGKQQTFLIGIDGCGGSGKSTLADEMKRCLDDVTIVHMDDFYFPSSLIDKNHPADKPVGVDFDWTRLLHQVLEPISQGKDGMYQRYDWVLDTLADYLLVPAQGIVIVEGVYSIRNELADKYDYRIWVDCPKEMRLSRGIERNGEDAREMWEKNWMISEDKYMEVQEPHKRADLVFNGAK